MIRQSLTPYVFMIAGSLAVLFSFPKIRLLTIGRLQRAGVVSKIKLKPKDRELFSGAGPNLSLFILGVMMIALGALELLYT